MNFKTTLPMLVHLANTDSGAKTIPAQWNALEATLCTEDLMAWDAYQDYEYNGRSSCSALCTRLAKQAIDSWLKAIESRWSSASML